jgi:hypothetical protein
MKTIIAAFIDILCFSSFIVKIKIFKSYLVNMKIFDQDEIAKNS